MGIDFNSSGVNMPKNTSQNQFPQIFGGLTDKGQETIGSIMSEVMQQAPNEQAYDPNTGLMKNLEELERLVFEEGYEGITLTTGDDGNHYVYVDEDGDGKTDRTSVYDKDGNKLHELIDTADSPGSEVIIMYDENGNVSEIRADKDGDGDVDYIESSKMIDGKLVNMVDEFIDNEDGTRTRNRAQYVNGENTYYEQDVGVDGSIEYQRITDQDNFVPWGESFETEEPESNIDHKENDNDREFNKEQ